MMLAFLLAASGAAHAASVLERVEVFRESTVSVRLRLSAPVYPVMRTLPGNAESPARVYLDFPNTILDGAAPAVVAGDASALLRVRTGQFDASTTRVVLDLSSAFPCRVRNADTTVTVEITPPRAAVAPPQPSLAPSRPAPVAATVPAPPHPAAVVSPPQRRAESTPAAPAPSATAPVRLDPVSPVAAALVLPEPAPPTPAAAPAPPAPVANVPAPPPVADAPASPTPAAIVTPPPTPAAMTPAAGPTVPASRAPAVSASESPSRAAAAAPTPPVPAAVPTPPDMATAPYLPPPGTIAPDLFPQVATAPAQPPPAPPMRLRPGPPLALTPPPLERALVVLDAGHGGHDPGAIGLGGVVEKEVTLELAQLVAARLRSELPVDVVLTRDDDAFVPIDARVERASEASLFVSLHANAAENPRLHGVEVFYGGGGIEAAAAGPLSPERLGRHVAEAIEQRLAPIRTTVRPGRFGVVVRNAVPSILVEIGYLTNPGDVARLGDENYRGLVAQAIADGTAAFLRAPGGVRRARRPVAAVNTCPHGGSSCRSGAQASARSEARS
jgi:N-acetylmuramoyl-L-alanine amidase